MPRLSDAAPAAGAPADLPAADWARLAPLGAVLIWSGNLMVTKVSATVIAPGAITFYRWAIAFAVLTLFVGRAVWRRRAAVVAHAGKLALLGALGMAAYQGLAYEAARTASAVHMGVMVALMPLLSALCARIVAGAPWSARQAGGALLSLAGLAALLTRGDPRALLAGAVHVGDLLMFVAVSSNALYGVLLRRWALPLTPWQQIHVQAGFGALVALPFWLAGPAAPITAANGALVAYAAVPASLLAPFCWMTGIRRYGAPRASLFMNLLPPLVALAAWAWLGEALSPWEAVGGAVALVGVAWGLKD